MDEESGKEVVVKAQVGSMDQEMDKENTIKVANCYYHVGGIISIIV